tara:strand:- start:155 stop:868 length:714 start_codon:yes stop_codon:yes gene_type:complete
MTKKAIVWEKWIDPLNSNIDEVEYPGHSLPAEDESYDIEFLSSDPDFEEKMDSYMDSGERERERNISINPTRITSTPHGFVTLTEHSFASKHFDFWTMHYNRDITESIIKKIEKCDGVETLTPLTRYRARIGFNRILIQAGVLNLSEAKRGIEKCILGNNKNRKSYEEEISIFSKTVISEVKKIISTKLEGKRSWFLYVFPNGNIESMSSETKGFEEKKKMFEQIQSLIGGKKIDSA